MIENMDKKIILVVDDAADNIRLLSGLLKKEYKVKAATSGEKALIIAEKLPQPDLVLLDVVMPEMDGFEVCRFLKSNPATAKIPVIFISGNFSEDDKRSGEQVGAVGFLSKPVQLDKLKILIEDHVL